LQTHIDQRTVAPGVSAPTGVKAILAEVAASVAPSNIDWPAVERAVEGSSQPLGISVSSFQGVRNAASGAAKSVAAPLTVGKVTLSATAPGMLAVADWLDSVAADPRFSEAWVSGLTLVTQGGGSITVQFTMEMSLSVEVLVGHASPTVAP
jgi:hypothetical protein